jgi:hypothetical protein
LLHSEISIEETQPSRFETGIREAVDGGRLTAGLSEPFDHPRVLRQGVDQGADIAA